MLRNSRPNAGQLRFAPLMRDEKRFCLRLQTVEKESSLIFCRKYLMPSSKEWRPGKVLVWDWRSLKQLSRATAARFTHRAKDGDWALPSQSSLKLRKTKLLPYLQRCPRSSTDNAVELL